MSTIEQHYEDCLARCEACEQQNEPLHSRWPLEIRKIAAQSLIDESHRHDRYAALENYWKDGVPEEMRAARDLLRDIARLLLPKSETP